MSLSRNSRTAITFISLLTILNTVYFLIATAPIAITLGALVGTFLLFRYVCFNWIDLEDGFCFEQEIGFTGLQPYPKVSVLREYLSRRGLYLRFSQSRPGVWHPDTNGVLLDEVRDDDVVGSSFDWNEMRTKVEQFARDIDRTSRYIPPGNEMKGKLNRAVNYVGLEVPVLPTLPTLPRPHARRAIAGDQHAQSGHALKTKMDGVSAMEASKVLLSGMDALGETKDRVIAAECFFSEGIVTSVAPASPQYQRLLHMLGPLKYSPRVEAHRAAATIRRAALNNASLTLEGAVVGLVSPSKAEMHVFPMAAIWLYDDALDASRRAKHCARCKAPRCQVLEDAKLAGRVHESRDWVRAADHFKRFDVSALVLINIEPNLNAETLTKLMVRSGVFNAMSLATVDWRVVMGRKSVDTLTGMTTELAYGKVVSSFKDGGDYVQSFANVKQMFAPTYASGHALRRTVIFGDGASQWFDLTLSQGGWATRCVPSYEDYYFIRLVLPDLTRPVVLVEKKGFDRVLATYRTQAIKDPAVARIVLRQSVVTYSISGTQVTPRIALTATESEALSVWIVVYSEVQDKMAEKHMDAMRPQTVTTQAKQGLYSAVTASLTATRGGAMALGAASTVDAILRAYRTDVGEFTLDQLSERAMEEHFGVKIDPLSLQNVVMNAWQSLCGWIVDPQKWVDPIQKFFKDSWNLVFSYIDCVMVAGLLGVRFSVDTMRVLVDCALVVARMTGKQEAVKKMTSFLDFLDWQQQKTTRFWVTTQSSQNLDFQAATIDIVETFFNVFGTDHAATIQEIREKDLLPAETIAELELNAALPYSDFLSEVKLFLGKFNSHVRRASMAAMLLNAFHHDKRSCSASQKAKMVHMIKKELKDVSVATKRQVMGYALTGKYESEPLPLRPINNQDVRESFDRGSIWWETGQGRLNVHKLNKVNGEYDFSPIHAKMDLEHGATVNPANLRGPNYISPDQRGADIQFALLQYAAAQGLGGRLCTENAMQPWLQHQLANPSIPYVDTILRRRTALFEGESVRNWIGHITGLAMGGKSLGVRQWVSSNDVVVVPTRRLKEEWQENLGKLDPVMRATVVTQHEALDVKYAARYVIIDECYNFDPEHLQAIANRHRQSQGVITVGDKRQIKNVFHYDEAAPLTLDLGECPCVMITPTTFVGWDAAVVYLNTTTTDVFIEDVYVGSEEKEALQYSISADDTLLPGVSDIAMQGTQKGKEVARMRGLDASTSHECQGRRSDKTVVHALGASLKGDLKWLGEPEQQAHMGVTITRARKATIFVVGGVEDFRDVPWVDAATVNGELPNTVMYGGTSWDLVEPRTESESTWEHLHVPNITETNLVETPLTDPITIGTVFTNTGEALSTAEIRTNVELSGQLTFRDDGIAHSDKFDNYTFQPRDVPGADQVQALTRVGEAVKATAKDFEDAEHIVELLFEEVLDKKKFFSHLSNSRRAALKRQTRQQVIDGCYAGTETATSTLSFAFLKPEFAKKPSEMKDGPSELKAQGVVSASDMQQALFADTCDSLTHAWARSMKKGKLSPVGLRESEVEDFLATYDISYELDIEKQDSSHKAVHIIVASIFIEMAADKLGLGAIAHEIREERRVRMMNTAFKFVLSMSLASGDPWTLIINKIMAFSSLISVAVLTDIRVCQSGDDVTMDREPEWRDGSLRSQNMANKGLTWKVEERDKRREGVTFISRAVLPHRVVVYKALRTILKYMVRQRNSIQHAGIRADAKRIEGLAARHGLQAYAEARAQVWGGDPVVIFDMWTRALAVANSDFESLPKELKLVEPRQYTIRQRDGGCFGYALAQCVKGNVQAINAIAMYKGPVTMTTALQVCRDNQVPIILINENFAKRSKKRLIDEMDRRRISRAFTVVYKDHAVAVVPNTVTIHGSFGKRMIRWKESMSKDVEITDFE